jgi:hypothetical protein
MLALAMAACLVSAIQDAQGAVGTLVWPPAAGPALHYEARLVKTRSLDPALRKAERDARKAAGLAPVPQAERSITLTVEVALEPTATECAARYRVKLAEQSLRLVLAEPVSHEAPAVLDPALFAALWVPPADPRAAAPTLPRALFERELAHAFRRDAAGLPALTPFDGAVDASLVPLLWESPLPCWLEHVVSIVDLSGVVVIEGKSLIQERTSRIALGPRTSRAEIRFAKASAGGFTMHYELRSDQRVDRVRGTSEPAVEPFVWRFEIEGSAKYSFAERAFDEIEETVKGIVVEPSQARLCALADEPFEGAIRVARVAGKPRGEKPRDREPRADRRR